MSIDAIGSYDDDDDLIKRAIHLQSLGGVNYTPPPIQIPAPQGLSSVSSIDSAQRKEVVPQHRPLIEEPQINIMIPLTALTQKLDQSRNRQAELIGADVKLLQEEREIHEEEVKSKLNKIAEDAKSAGTWETAVNVSQYALGLAAIGVGATLGGWPAYLLIASGVVGIGNRAIHDTNILQSGLEWYSKSEEVQKRVSQNIEMGFFTLQMGLGLAGGFAAGVGTPLSNSLSTGFALFGGGARVGADFYNKKLSDTNSALTRTRYQITANNQTIDQYAKDASKMIENSEIEVMRNAIRSQEVSMD